MMRRFTQDIDELLSAAPPPGAVWWTRGGDPAGPRAWRLKRNCSLRPPQYLAAIALLMSLAALVALACWVRGIWLVPLFCGAELVVIAVAALAYARHAIDGEIVAVTQDRRLRVEIDRGLVHTCYLFDAGRVRLIKPAEAPDTLWLHHGTTRVQLAAYTSAATRDAFEGELRRALRDITT
jgi:uncharacterized membrane protein